MNRDLEEQLAEMGPEYRAVVDRLVAAHRPYAAKALTSEVAARKESRGGRVIGWTIGYLVAASLLVFLGLGLIFRSAPSEDRIFTVRASDAGREYTLAFIRNDEAVMEMIKTQNSDGSWKNDFLTRQNAAALKECRSEAAQIAYKKAMHNLRSRGLR